MLFIVLLVLTDIQKLCSQVRVVDHQRLSTGVQLINVAFELQVLLLFVFELGVKPDESLLPVRYLLLEILNFLLKL